MKESESYNAVVWYLLVYLKIEMYLILKAKPKIVTLHFIFVYYVQLIPESHRSATDIVIAPHFF